MKNEFTKICFFTTNNDDFTMKNKFTKICLFFCHHKNLLIFHQKNGDLTMVSNQ